MNTRAHSALNDIAVKVEMSSGNIRPLLHEIRHALALLLKDGTSTCIDLKGIPLAPGEEERIVTALGTGEVRATIAVLGASEIAETAFAGVWIVTHYDEKGATQARFVEVTHVPELLRSQHSDISEGLARLTTHLATD